MYLYSYTYPLIKLLFGVYRLDISYNIQTIISTV